MAIKSAKPGIPVSRVDQCTLARDRRAATSKKRKSEQDIAKLTGLTRNGLSLLPVRFRQLLDDVQFDLCDTPVNHSQRSGCRIGDVDDPSGNERSAVIDVSYSAARTLGMV